jgi:hypothetical protein
LSPQKYLLSDNFAERRFSACDGMINHNIFNQLIDFNLNGIQGQLLYIFLGQVHNSFGLFSLPIQVIEIVWEREMLRVAVVGDGRTVVFVQPKQLELNKKI